MPSILIHYHEIALKRGNRPLFLRHLAQNLARATGDLGPVRVRRLTGRMASTLMGLLSSNRSDILFSEPEE